MSEGGGASRSTDPAAGTSSATDVSLKEYLVALIEAAESRSDLRFEAMKDAVDKAEAAAEKRLEGFPRLFADTAELKALGEKLQDGIDRNREDLDHLAERLDLNQGQDEGTRVTRGGLYTVVGLGIAFLVFVIAVANYLAGH